MFLKPDKIITLTVGGKALTVNQKIIPDSLRAAKDVASYVKKGQPMKPCAPVGPAGKPLGITVQNTNDIKVAAGTNAAEQYSRATYNGNMRGVVVHYYVWRDEIWQLLRLNERGWHASDGKTRRAGRRPGQKIGGNLDTIAIEAIGPSAETEDTTAALCAWLCREFGLDPALDIWQHWDFSGKDCPLYIRPHWKLFLETVADYLKDKPAPAPTPKPAPVEITHKVVKGDTLWSLAVRYLGDGQKWRAIQALNGGIDPRRLRIGSVLKIPSKEEKSK
jgi:N-acetylmuramoyl-L-alanine amidase CwlA